jgi:Vacuolar protein sorting protein 36 Vps36
MHPLELTKSPRKYKIPHCQQGYAYLTSLRVCYVDEKDPRKHSAAFDLREIERVEYQVCADPYLAFSHSKSNSGRFLKIISKDHPTSEAFQRAWVNAKC